MKLSICIPTYNRAEFLAETLDAFLPLLAVDVEVVISDNASEDDTASVVDAFRQRFPQVVYHRWPQNMGADLNYLKVVELAKGEYCWLFGSDDIPRLESMTYIREAIQSRCDVALFNYLWCDFGMQPFRCVFGLNPKIGRKIFLMQYPSDFISYFKNVNCIAGFFSYLSVILFRRQCWNSIRYDARFRGTAYSHAFILMSALRDGAIFQYDPRILVNTRHGNDSFAVDGRFKRVMIDIKGYRVIRDIVFPQNQLAHLHINRVLRQDYPWWYVARLRLEMRKEEFSILLKEFQTINYPEWQLQIAMWSGCFKSVFKVLLYIKIKIWMPLRRFFLKF
jgi:abequosyltransferase